MKNFRIERYDGTGCLSRDGWLVRFVDYIVDVESLETQARTDAQTIAELSYALSELVEVSKIAAMIGMFGDEGIRDDHNGPLPNAIRLLERLARSAPDSAGAKL